LHHFSRPQLPWQELFPIDGKRISFKFYRHASLLYFF
jgi:hypothetical protein